MIPNNVRRQRAVRKKSRTLSFKAFDPDPSAVGFDNHLTDHQAKAGAPVSRVFDVVALAIFLEQTADLIGSYTDAVVFNPYFDSSRVRQSGAHLHLPIFAGEIDGVANQVTKDLLQTPRIGMDGDERRFDRVLD